MDYFNLGSTKEFLDVFMQIVRSKVVTIMERVH
jgi:hypothetical protein